MLLHELECSRRVDLGWRGGSERRRQGLEGSIGMNQDVLHTSVASPGQE